VGDERIRIFSIVKGYKNKGFVCISMGFIKSLFGIKDKPVENSEEKQKAAAESKKEDSPPSTSQSHFKDVGFDFSAIEEYREFLESNVKDIKKKIKTEFGEYTVYRDGKIEMWTLTKEGNILDTDPYYDGESRLDLRFAARSRNREWPASVYLEELKDGIPLLINVPNYWEIARKIKEGERYKLQITAFGEGASFYDNEKDFEENSPFNTFSPCFFVPSGTFRPNSNEPRADPEALFAAKIEKLKIITNKRFKKRFYWILGKNLIGDIDIVIAENALRKKPKVGGLVAGQFYMGGKFKI